MEPDGNPEARYVVHDHEYRHVNPAQPPAPGNRNRREQRRKRDDHEGPESDDDADRLLPFGERLLAGRRGWRIDKSRGHDTSLAWSAVASYARLGMGSAGYALGPRAGLI